MIKAHLKCLGPNKIKRFTAHISLKEIGSDELDDKQRCEQLDKLLKLGALKLQVILTRQDLELLQII